MAVAAEAGVDHVLRWADEACATDAGPSQSAQQSEDLQIAVERNMDVALLQWNTFQGPNYKHCMHYKHHCLPTRHLLVSWPWRMTVVLFS